MKKRFSSILVAAAAVVLSSCNQWIDYNLNIDPNNPNDVTPNLYVAQIQAANGWLYGSAIGRLGQMFVQQFQGTDRQQQGLYNYSLNITDGNDSWDIAYTNGLTNINILLDKTRNTSNLVYYRGIAQVMKAQTIGIVTDTWGDVPFSQAGLAVPNLNPKYDTQQEIYAAIQIILDSAITDLNATSGIAISNDLMFEGDRTKWRRLAWMLKARYAIHLTKRQGNAAATAALMHLSRGMTSNEDNAQVRFGASATTANPLYQFQEARTGDLAFGSTFKTMLEGLKDPRLGPYGTEESTYPGFGPFFHEQTSPVPLALFSEQKFIEAEANQRLGNNDAAKAAYTAGIRASLEYIGVPASEITAYLAQPSVTPTGNVSLQQIMEQKHIALFTQLESWTDWRRTGFPTLRAIRGANIPRRLLTPATELQYNRANIPTGSTDLPWIYTRVWWDAN
jgi:hypothetical protein